MSSAAAVGTEATGLARRALFAFIVTFICARTLVLLIMARRIPNLYLFMGSVHVHHLNYGIFLLGAVSAYLLFAQPRGRALRISALVWGIAMALTFDEFGMWLHLGGSYWQRASIDAVTVLAALLALIGFASALRRFESRHLLASLLLLVVLAGFAAALHDASVKLGRIEGPRLQALEEASSP
jgi:hypothetical protein